MVVGREGQVCCVVELAGHVLEVGVVEEVQVLISRLHRTLLQALARHATLPSTPLKLAGLREQLGDVLLALLEILSGS